MATGELELDTADRIEWCLRHLGLKPGALAKAARIPPATLYNYRAGTRKIPAGSLRAIAIVLQTSTDFLLAMTDDPGPAYGKDAKTRMFLDGILASFPRTGTDGWAWRAGIKSYGPVAIAALSC